MQRNHQPLACVCGLFVVAVCCITYVAFYKHTIAHNKVIIIDGGTVITGSFNFTKAAEEKNAENLLVIKDRKLAERYTKNWQEHAKHSGIYTGKGM